MDFRTNFHMMKLTCRWCVYYDIGIFETVSEFLSTRRIPDLSISFISDGKYPKSSFPNMVPAGLHSLHIGGHLEFGDDFEEIVANCKELAPIVESSPGLANLSIMIGSLFHNQETTMIPTLRDFLPSAMGRPPMRLKSLSLENVRVPLDKTTLYHLRSLESLSIHFNFKYPPPVRDSPFPMVNVHILDVEDELLDYLSSYEGIQELRFDSSSGLSKSSTAETDDVATRFFCEVLPNIAGTLEVLHLGGTFRDRWCFDESYREAILKCMQLKELTVSVDVDSPQSPGVEACLNETAAHLPDLLRLKQLQASVMPYIV
ncbi:hypothetical protein BDZ97DRAFT_1828256 [Flammula alnicola]|nr:hypothetical protein BDZ97DRAFT_1828256 [Flammula alnicola]